MSEEMREEMEQNTETGTEDIYQVYMEELAVIPPCTEEENRELLKRVKAGDREAKNRLVEGNLKKALFFIQDYLNRGVPMADLIQEASMELMELADEGFQEGFEKLLESRIHVRMEEVIREQKAEMDLEEEMLARVNVLQEVSKRMAEELGREASLKELAERMKMTEEDVREIMKISQDPVSLETPIGEEEDSHLGDFIQDNNVEVPADAATYTLLHEQLMDVLSTLTEREQKVLRLRFGLDDGRPRTLEEVGRQFNVTRERIRQIEAKALRKLRHPSRSKILKDYLDE